MADPLPPEVTATAGAHGVRYRFPRRPLGGSRWIGLAGGALGVVLCCLPLGAAGMLLRIVVQQLPAESGWFWLLVTIFTLPAVPVGLKTATVGLFVLVGHSEIELCRDTLSARECCGPLRWAWQRSTADLRRFLVSDRLGPSPGTGTRAALAAALNFLFCGCGDLGVIIPEWKAAVGHANVPLWLAPGYPRPWLLAVADDLARRCTPPPGPATAPEAGAPAQAIIAPVPAFPISPVIPPPPRTRPEPTSAPAPPRIAVVEQDADLSRYEELDERPAGSRIVADTTAGGLTFIVPPPGWEANRGWVAGGVVACLIALGLSLSLCGGAQSIGGATVTVLLALPAWAIGIGVLLVASDRARRRVVLDVTGDTLVVWQPGLFRVRPRRWARQHVADVFVMHYLRDEDDPEYWELQVHPQPGHGEPLRLLGHCHEAELRWLATRLRRTLQCPGTSPLSPPPGYVVRSPGLIERWYRRRPTT
jgi:hypothetical protein